MDTAGAECPPPPPSYETAVLMDSNYASLDRNVGAAKDTTQGPTVSDSPHNSDDEEVGMLKAELRRLRLEKLEKTKRQLREEIGRERTYSGTGMRTMAAGMSGSQSCSGPTQYRASGGPTQYQASTGSIQYQASAGPSQYQASGYSSTPQITGSAPSTSTVVHPVATAQYVPPSPGEDPKDKSDAGKACCIVLLFFMVVIVIIFVAVLS